LVLFQIATEKMEERNRVTFLKSFYNFGSSSQSRERCIDRNFRSFALRLGPKPKTYLWYERVLGEELRPTRSTKEWERLVDNLVEALKAIPQAECSYIHHRLNAMHYNSTFRFQYPERDVCGFNIYP
jgi:hypothetical protein